jgi:hypothetical protein
MMGGSALIYAFALSVMRLQLLSEDLSNHLALEGKVIPLLN